MLKPSEDGALYSSRSSRTIISSRVPRCDLPSGDRWQCSYFLPRIRKLTRIHRSTSLIGLYSETGWNSRPSFRKYLEPSYRDGTCRRFVGHFSRSFRFCGCRTIVSQLSLDRHMLYNNTIEEHASLIRTSDLTKCSSYFGCTESMVEPDV